MNQRIAFAIDDSDTRVTIAEHFGKSSKFKVCEIDKQKKILKDEIYFNPIVSEYKGVSQLPAYIKQFNVNTIIAGKMGQKAISEFLSFGISVVTAPGLEFQDAIDRFLEGKLICFSADNHSHNN